MNTLARVRAYLGLTQPEMARLLGLSFRTYQRRETLAEKDIPKAEWIAARALTSECANEILGERRSRNPLLES